MTALRTKVPVRYRNPHASGDLTLELDVIENTPIEELNGNVTENSKMYKDWLHSEDAHDTPAILIGGGASINDHIEDIKNLQREGATVFAMNAASIWARKHGIEVDYQLILDAKPETVSLVDPLAKEHLFASQCSPKTLAAAKNLTLWHLARSNVEDLLPPDRVKEGGYVIVGGDSSVGICGLCLVFTQGYRELHCFGYDTSYRDGKGHGYKQRMNDTMPTMTTQWAGKEYTIALAMKDQCSNFIAFSAQLKDEGCDIHVYGEGLLQTMWRTEVSSLSEKDKYRLMWMFPHYRDISPGEQAVKFYVEKFKPVGRVIDFGCGTGKGAVKLHEAGLEPQLIDFADNSRDDVAEDFPFMEWDLTEKIPAESKYGFCTDVMEHIPTEDVDKVIQNIMTCSEEVFFMISTIPDLAGEAIGAILHNTVKPHKWWYRTFKNLGYKIEYDQDIEIASIFYVRN